MLGKNATPIVARVCSECSEVRELARIMVPRRSVLVFVFFGNSARSVGIPRRIQFLPSRKGSVFEETFGWPPYTFRTGYISGNWTASNWCPNKILREPAHGWIECLDQGRDNENNAYQNDKVSSQIVVDPASSHSHGSFAVGYFLHRPGSVVPFLLRQPSGIYTWWQFTVFRDNSIIRWNIRELDSVYTR